MFYVKKLRCVRINGKGDFGWRICVVAGMLVECWKPCIGASYLCTCWRMSLLMYGNVL